MDFDSIFSRDAPGEKTRAELADSLRALVPLLAFSHTLGHGKWGVCLKNCGGISTDLAIALSMQGFDARVVSKPGHFTCGVNVEGVGVDIDLSHLQFDDRVTQIHAESDSPESEVHDAFFPSLWENPYRIGRIEIRSAFRSGSHPLQSDTVSDIRRQLELSKRFAAKAPGFGAKADARDFLAPLLDG